MRVDIFYLLCVAVCGATAAVLLSSQKTQDFFPQKHQRLSKTPLARLLMRLYRNIRKRLSYSPSARELCLSEMPEMIDVMTLALSAGLSFDSSLELYCLRSEHLLSRLMNEAQASWYMGLMSREEALRDLAERLDLPALVTFASATHDALVFGRPLAQVLESLAIIMRDEQKNKLERRLEQLPIKMLIPLGTLILPAMLLSILGPLLVAAAGSV